MEDVLIGLGSNIGNRTAALESALNALANLPQTRLGRVSRFVETRPVGGEGAQGPFLNAAALLETGLPPETLLSQLQRIEAESGRRREKRWGPRTLDLDLLLYGGITIAGEDLTIPHPRMAWRRFVLEPAVEVAPQMIHPTLGWSLSRLLRHLDETQAYVAVAGSIGAGKSSLVRELEKTCSVHPVWEEVDGRRLGEFYADPRARAWEMECHFLARRSEALDHERFTAAGKEWAMSDFWFDQSDAFAEVWLEPEQYEEFHKKWLAIRSCVVTPKLIVCLQALPRTLKAAVEERDRPFESELTAETLGRIQDAVAERLRLPDQGPRLIVHADSDEDAGVEVRAALEGMRKSVAT